MAEFIDDYTAPTEEPEAHSFDPLPPGDYLAHITQSEIADTRTGTGRMVKLTWEVLDGQFERRLVWQQINYRNQSQKAEEVGKRQLDEVVWSTGVQNLTDTEQLHWIPCIITVKVEGAKGGYGPKNVITRVRRNDAPAARQPAPARQSQQQAPAQNTAPRQAPAARGSGPRPWPRS
jgi:hypothetical protein